jgi:hypothetical protein
MYKTVHATHSDDTELDDSDINSRSLIPESIIQWRENAWGEPVHNIANGYPGGPDYTDRSLWMDTDGVPGLELVTQMENTRGFTSPAEIGMLQQSGANLDDLATMYVDNIVYEPWHVQQGDDVDHDAARHPDAWRISFAASEPFLIPDSFDSFSTDPLLDLIGANLSTDVVTTSFSYAPPYNDWEGFYGSTAYTDDLAYHTVLGDRVSGDSEELNLLQSGISNLITTTSDMFTVHMRIRTFKRNPITGVWNATDLDHIIDDSRYVMLVDRSEVNTPADKPKILYFEKLPN